MKVHQLPPLPLQAHSLLGGCLFLSCSFQLCFVLRILLPTSWLFIIMFYFSFSSLSLPPFSLIVLVVSCFLFLASWQPLPCDFLQCWPPVLCDLLWQYLPITVRNLPSINPLILKRLKVQFSLPLYSAVWMPADVIYHQKLLNSALPSC